MPKEVLPFYVAETEQGPAEEGEGGMELSAASRGVGSKRTQRATGSVRGEKPEGMGTSLPLPRGSEHQSSLAKSRQFV